VEIVGLIPARGGSKAIPRKNLALLLGKPLLRWTLDAARDSKLLTRLVVSTDDDEIAGASSGADVLRRPAELAGDETPMLDVIRHALGELDACDVLVLLQPTSPLRTGEHVDGAVGLLLETRADSVVSVVAVPHRFAPASLMELRDGRLVPVDSDPPTRRQDKPLLYARNGPAVLALTAAAARGTTLYGGECRPFVMEAHESIDIDDAFDLELAEFLLGRREGRG
jgi:CMP-N,N'-diacetyllegionaminic acid synthase